MLRDRDGQQEVLIIHRPIREDWSIPKGKIDPGEHVLSAAVRECDEETGLIPILGCPLPTQSYRAMNQAKVVQYWRATLGEDVGFYPDDETDEIAWVPVTKVKDHLTYPSDVALVKGATALPETTPIILLRHTQAVKRSNFDGADDSFRPLSSYPFCPPTACARSTHRRHFGVDRPWTFWQIASTLISRRSQLSQRTNMSSIPIRRPSEFTRWHMILRPWSSALIARCCRRWLGPSAIRSASTCATNGTPRPLTHASRRDRSS